MTLKRSHNVDSKGVKQKEYTGARTVCILQQRGGSILVK